MRVPVAAMLVYAAVADGEPVSCGQCHAKQARQQQGSYHARALLPYDGRALAGKSTRERGGTVYRYDRQGLTVLSPGGAKHAAIQWLFGGGHTARTPVFLDRGQWVEHRVSLYPQTASLRLTPGHSTSPSGSLATSLGKRLTPDDAAQCFGCHSSAPDIPGVHCQRCHGSGEGHAGKGDIVRDAGMALCIDCHKPAPMKDGPPVRSAPVGLAASKCFQMSEGKLTCVTCHDPHRDTDLMPWTTYNAACVKCHSEASRVEQCAWTNCVECHMPRSREVPNFRFSDHRIQKGPN